MQNFIPHIIERVGNTERVMDIYSRLLQDRIVYLGDEVNSVTANAIIAQLLFLQTSDPQKPVHFYINSPGGSISDGMAIYDTVQLLHESGIIVNTYCIGMAASMGAVLLSGGSKGHRHALKNSRVMIHQPLGGSRGQSDDIVIQTSEILRWKRVLYKYLADNTGQTLRQITKDCVRDNYMPAEKAKAYGLIDHIITKFPSALPK